MMSIIDSCSICFPNKKSLKKGEKKRDGPKPTATTVDESDGVHAWYRARRRKPPCCFGGEG